MPATEWDEPATEYKMREGRRLIGFALGHHPDPEELYTTLERPRPSLLIGAASTRISLEYANTTGEISGASDVFMWGMHDVARLTIPSLARHPSIPKEQALLIAASHKTVMAHAIGASIPVEESEELLFSRPQEAFALSGDHTHIEIIDPDIAPNTERGCAAVQIIDGELQVDPIFERFAVWAGHLAVISHFDHRN